MAGAVVFVSLAGGFVWFLSRPLPDGPPQTVLITAAHVVEQMEGDEVDLLTRKPGPDDSFEKVPVKVRLRQEGKPLWAKHPALDVAALAISLPKEVEPPLLSVDLLATDELSVKQIHAAFAMSQPAVSQHLLDLRLARLVTVRRVHRENRYRLTAAPLRQVFTWLDKYRHLVDPAGHHWAIGPSTDSK